MFIAFFLIFFNPGVAELETSILARQLVEDQCYGPGSLPMTLPKEPLNDWASLEQRFLNAQVTSYVEGPTAGSAACLSVLETLLREKYVLAFSCPLLTSKLIHQCATLVSHIGEKVRARTLLQMGNMFKLQAISQWYGYTQVQKKRGESFANRYETRMQSDYSLALTALFQSTQSMPRDIITPPRGHPLEKAKFEIVSICAYADDPTSNTGIRSTLPDITPPNHQSYADRFGYKYTVYRELPESRRSLEAHYSKMLVVSDILARKVNPPDWAIFVDCDAIFTDFSTSLSEIIYTYTIDRPETAFLVAEDTGGINSGVFAVKNVQWGRDFLSKAAIAPYTTAWDQSQLFWEAIKTDLFTSSNSTCSDHKLNDFQLPPQVTFMHQRHLNAFVPPASKDWQAYEWQPGDFIRHFAGCPWQEKVCLDMFHATLEWADQQRRAL